jgi:hypothetical protein
VHLLAQGVLVCETQAILKAPDIELNYERFFYLASRDPSIQDHLDKYAQHMMVHVGSKLWWEHTRERRRIIAFEQPWKDVVQQLTGNMPTKASGTRAVCVCFCGVHHWSLSVWCESFGFVQNGSFLSWTETLPTAVNDTNGFDVMHRAEELEYGSRKDVQAGDVAVVVPRALVKKEAEGLAKEAAEHDRLNAIREIHDMPPLPLPAGKQFLEASTLKIKNIPLKQVTVGSGGSGGKKVFVAPGVIPGQQKVWTHEMGVQRNFWFLAKTKDQTAINLSEEGLTFECGWLFPQASSVF